ncbi:hypothetical protein [Clostridium sp.]|uniref:hypothetical protein n=1 Tax=Clostridium sp. TaxID=1506 RepID=UPI002622FFE8|nr:hypothetical protein [Clostridium sp.]
MNTRIIDIIDRMESKPIRISISSREDRIENKQAWKWYGERIHRSKSSCGYKLEEWEEVCEYIFEHECDS